MNKKLNELELTLFLEGEINSSNAESVEKEINEELKGEKFTSLVLNIRNVTYISSAGLRIILKLKQKYNKVSIVDASLEVYDILSMTGFTNIMNVEKALNELSVEGCPVIGEGYFSIVYRYDKDTIIKLFKRDVDIKEVERELNLAKEAFILGIPTAISFDIVLVNGHYGVRFEMLNSENLRDLFVEHPEREEELIKRYAELLLTINHTESDDDKIPSTKNLFLKKIESLKGLIDDDMYDKLIKIISNIPDRNTFVHGDCHVKNIMSQNGELFLIDMDTLSRGHPIFELAALYGSYLSYEQDDPGNNERFFGLPSTLVKRIYNGILRNYFPEYKEEYLEKISLVCYTHIVWWRLMNERENQVLIDKNIDRIKVLLDKYDNVDIGL